MFGPFWRLLDWTAIQLAAARMPSGEGVDPRLAEATQFVNSDCFAVAASLSPVALASDFSFTFPSPRPSPFDESNTVFGRLYSCGADWRAKPAVIFVHGWNDVNSHYFFFPRFAKKFVEAGMNAVTMELPYHFQRRPRGRLGVASNFLSAEIFRTAQAAAQAVADIIALANWLKAQGCPRIGLLGVSLGGWLGGLAACHGAQLDAAALVVPVSRLDRTIAEIAFCAPIRAALGGQKIELGRLNLLAATPQVSRENLLLISAKHDQFVPSETIEDLWEHWDRPEIWRLPMGHVSVLAMSGLSRRLVAWFGSRLASPVVK